MTKRKKADDNIAGESELFVPIPRSSGKPGARRKKHIPHFMQGIVLSNGLKITVEEIIKLLVEYHTTEQIARQYAVAFDEILSIRQAYKLLGKYKSKTARTADYAELIQPIFYRLSMREKGDWAKRCNLSISQLYRIAGKDSVTLKNRIPKKPRQKQKMFDRSPHVWEAKRKYQTFSGLQKGKRAVKPYKVDDDTYKLSQKCRESFRTGNVLVEPSFGELMEFEQFSRIFKGFQNAENPYSEFASALNFDVFRVKGICLFHVLPVSKPKTLSALSKVLSAFYEYSLIFSLFDRRQFRYSGAYAPQFNTVEKICQTFNISSSTLYRSINAKAIRDGINPSQCLCYTTIRIAGRYYDVDSFLHESNTDFRLLSFPLQ